jgi:hypothetical protein
MPGFLFYFDGPIRVLTKVHIASAKYALAGNAHAKFSKDTAISNCPI